MVRSGSRVQLWVACLLLAFPATATGKTYWQRPQRWELQGCWEDLGGAGESEVGTGRAGQPAQGRSPQFQEMPELECILSRQGLCPCGPV